MINHNPSTLHRWKYATVNHNSCSLSPEKKNIYIYILLTNLYFSTWKIKYSQAKYGSFFYYISCTKTIFLNQIPYRIFTNRICSNLKVGSIWGYPWHSFWVFMLAKDDYSSAFVKYGIDYTFYSWWNQIEVSKSPSLEVREKIVLRWTALI